MRTSILAFALPLALVASAASAQDTSGGAGSARVLVGVERVFGFSSTATKTHLDAPLIGSVDASTTTTTFSLFGTNPASVYSLPRVAVDVVVAPRITLGGSFVWSHQSVSTDVSGLSGGSSSEPSADALAFAPRVGGLIAVSDIVTFVPRVGVTYFRQKSTSTASNGSQTSDTLSGLGLDLEPTLLVQVAPHVGLTAAAVLDLPLSGSLAYDGTSSSTSYDVKVQNFGVQLGITGWL